MRCLQCSFVSETGDGVCPRCGYRQGASSSAQRHAIQPVTLAPMSGPMSLSGLKMSASTTTSASSIPSFAPEYNLMRGDALGDGHYRLLESIPLPRNQQGQGPAWFATDMQAGRRRVVIRKIEFPADFQGDQQQALEAIVARFQSLADYPCFPTILEVLHEQDSYYVVFTYPAGITLAALMTQQGGALPERDVAEYGRQLSEMLCLLANLQPPWIHGGISPETIVVNPETGKISLLFLPLLPLQALSKDNTLPGYLAPEQVRGSNLLSSDLYSLTATLHHAITGYAPQERLAFFYPPARRLNPVVTAGMEAILARGLRLSVSQRYAHPADMQKELSDLIVSYPPIRGLPPPLVIQPYGQNLLIGKNNMGVAGIISICLLILFILLFAVPPLLQSGINGSATATAVGAQSALTQEFGQELQAYQKKNIGISEGRLVFDPYPGRLDADLKKQAAQALQKGNISGAINLLNQAVSADPIDGEAQIYNENLHVLQDGSSYVTIVVGLPIDGSDVYLSSDRVTLQSIYLAQHETNSKNLLPNHLKLRILIANSGSNNADVATVAQFINNRVTKANNLDHIIAVVGWPYSSQTVNALQSIVSANIPLVAATASSVKLSGISPYFFRVCPADDLQGAVLGNDLIANKLGSKKIMVLHDPTDTYSVSLSNAVASQVLRYGISITQNTFTEKVTTVDVYQQMVEQALTSNVDTIFMAGYSVDGIRLAHAVGNEARLHPFNTQLQNLKIVGSDTMPGGVLVGEGNDADADIARKYPQDIQRILLTSYADAKEWDVKGIPPTQQPAFLGQWKSTYVTSPFPSDNAPLPTYEGILAYDATKTILYAAAHTSGQLTGDAIRHTLTMIGKGNLPAYQGFSGRILFNDKGDPVDKAVVVLAVQDNGNGGSQIVLQQVIGTFQ